MRGVPLQEPLDGRQALLAATQRKVDLRERNVCALEARVLLQEVLEEADGVFGPAARNQHQGQVVHGLPVVRLPQKRLAEVGLGALQLAFPSQDQAEVVQSLRKVRLERERLLVELARLPRPPRQQQRVAEVVERVRVVRRRRERRPEPLDGGRYVAVLREQRAQVVARLGEVGLQRQGALEGRLGLGRLLALREQRAELVERRGARVAEGGALERDDRRRLQALLQQLAAVGEVVPLGLRRVERPREGRRAGAPLLGRGLDRARV